MDRHAVIAGDPSFRAAHIDNKKLDLYAGYFTDVYNKAWAGHGGMKQLKLDQVKQMFQPNETIHGRKTDLVHLSQR